MRISIIIAFDHTSKGGGGTFSHCLICPTSPGVFGQSGRGYRIKWTPAHFVFHQKPYFYLCHFILNSWTGPEKMRLFQCWLFFTNAIIILADSSSTKPFSRVSKKIFTTYNFFIIKFFFHFRKLANLTRLKLITPEIRLPPVVQLAMSRSKRRPASIISRKSSTNSECRNSGILARLLF